MKMSFDELYNRYFASEYPLALVNWRARKAEAGRRGEPFNEPEPQPRDWTKWRKQ